MRKHNIPTFEVDGKTYEIKRTRYLQAEFDDMMREIQMSDEEQVLYVKEQEFSDRLEKLKNRKEELYAQYLETFDDADEEKYLKAQAAFNRLVDEASETESVSSKYRKSFLAMGEKLIIMALQVNDNGEQICSTDEAKSVWERFVEENGKVVAIQFVTYTTNYIMGGDEETDNPFIAQAKAKAEQKASMKKGIVKGR